MGEGGAAYPHAHAALPPVMGACSGAALLVRLAPPSIRASRPGQPRLVLGPAVVMYACVRAHAVVGLVLPRPSVLGRAPRACTHPAHLQIFVHQERRVLDLLAGARAAAVLKAATCGATCVLLHVAVACLPQGTILVVLVWTGVIKSDAGLSPDKRLGVAGSIQDFLICIEMFVAAIAHAYAFAPGVGPADLPVAPPLTHCSSARCKRHAAHTMHALLAAQDYVAPYDQGQGFLHNFRQLFDVNDVTNDVRMVSAGGWAQPGLMAVLCGCWG